MSGSKGVSVEVVKKAKEGFVFFTGAKSLPQMEVDFTRLDPEERKAEHWGARFLLCAALVCYTETFSNRLTAAGAEPMWFRGRASVAKEKDDTRRTRYTELTLQLQVGVEEKNRAVFERVRSDMERGSLLTYSLGEGIEVVYDVQGVSSPL